jgi:hypothetical protein
MTDLKKNKTVLMLDHEPLMIDRRIILESKTLVKQGYDVTLATRGDGIKPAKEFLGEIEIRRFVDPWILRLVKSRQLIDGWIYSPGNPVIEASVRSNLFFCLKNFKIFSMHLYGHLLWLPFWEIEKLEVSLRDFLGGHSSPQYFF